MLTQVIDFLHNIVVFLFDTNDRNDPIGLHGGDKIGISIESIANDDVHQIEEMGLVDAME